MTQNANTNARAIRPLRRDAERNRLRILAAARTVLARRGLEASLDEVAREAGLGIGTVYRRFPGRQALFDALIAEVLGTIDGIIAEARARPRAWEGLAYFLVEMLRSQAADKSLRDVMLAGAVHGRPRDGGLREKIRATLCDLVQGAQQAGDVRPDLAPTDIAVLQVAVLGIIEFVGPVAPDVWRRYLALILESLRGRPSRAALHPPALTEADLETCVAAWRYGATR